MIVILALLAKKKIKLIKRMLTGQSWPRITLKITKKALDSIIY